jgi:hypothetical protein
MKKQELLEKIKDIQKLHASVGMYTDHPLMGGHDLSRYHGQLRDTSTKDHMKALRMAVHVIEQVLDEDGI